MPRAVAHRRLEQLRRHAAFGCVDETHDDAQFAQREPGHRVGSEFVGAENDLVARTPVEPPGQDVGSVAGIAQKRNLATLRADESADAFAEALEMHFNGKHAQHAALHLTVDEFDDRVAGAPRQQSRGRVVEIDDALSRRELFAAKRGTVQVDIGAGKTPSETGDESKGESVSSFARSS